MKTIILAGGWGTRLGQHTEWIPKPMVQVGKDYYEDLSVKDFKTLLKDLVTGGVPLPGSQKRRFSSEPRGKLTSLIGKQENKFNASVSSAVKLGDTIKRIRE